MPSSIKKSDYHFIAGKSDGNVLLSHTSSFAYIATPPRRLAEANFLIVLKRLTIIERQIYKAMQSVCCLFHMAIFFLQKVVMVKGSR